MKPGSLHGQSVVVLGAASGIGAATGRALLDAGARVALADVAPLSVPDSERAFAIHADVTRADTLVALRDAAIAAYGPIHAVVNCAGVIVPGAVDHVPVEALHHQINVNFLGTVLVTRTFLPHFRAQASGHLVHVGSLGGIVPLAGEATYSATKFAVRGFCLALALELRGTGISVSVVCPDSTDTAQLTIEATRGGSPLSFLSDPLQPADVAAAIVRTIRRPRLEVAVPHGRGLPAKLLTWSPALLHRVYPLLERLGVAKRDRFRATTSAASATPAASAALPEAR